MAKVIQDGTDENTYFVLTDNKPIGYVTQFAPTEWDAFDKDGKFLGWSTNKKLAVSRVVGG